MKWSKPTLEPITGSQFAEGRCRTGSTVTGCGNGQSAAGQTCANGGNGAQFTGAQHCDVGSSAANCMNGTWALG